jgi:hypothetical protein
MRRTTSIASLLLSLGAPAFTAEPAPVAPESLVACADVKDPRARLACFDREIAPAAKTRNPAGGSGSSRPPPTAPVAPPVAPAPPPPAPAATPPSFGQEQLGTKAPARSEEQALHAKIATIRKVNTAAWLVTLDNGQAWRHEDPTRGAYLAEGEPVTISKGTLGSYRLARDADGSNNWIRVTRVR